MGVVNVGDASPQEALDRQVMQKVLPRVHGTRRRLEDTLCALAHFCFDPTYTPGCRFPSIRRGGC